jgi:hypothetical protein
VLFPCFFAQSSLQAELDFYFEVKKNNPLKTREITKSAYSHARKKYDHGIYKFLDACFLASVQEKYLYKTFWGWRVLGIDGTLIDLPKNKELAKRFGVIKAKNGDSGPRARVSAAYDCLNHVSYDAIIESKNVGERELASLHIDAIGIGENDIITLDRGYEAFWLFIKIIQSGGHFCARMPLKWKEVKAFRSNPDEVDKVVEIKLNYFHKRKCAENGITAETFKVRLVKVELKSGEIEILATSIFDQECGIDFFKELYNLRWQTEENYKNIKCRIRIEKWMGKTPEAIFQEFYARIFMLNVTSVIRHEADMQLSDKRKKKRRKNKSKTKCKVNFKAALSKIRRAGMLMFVGSAMNLVSTALDKMIDKMTGCITWVVPGRSYERNKRNINGEFQTYSNI